MDYIGSYSSNGCIDNYKKTGSVYKNQPNEQNPMEGKKVRFIESNDDAINADGMRGHLESIGITNHSAGIYEEDHRLKIDVSDSILR